MLHALFSCKNRYNLEIEVVSYANFGNRDFTGSCCDAFCDNPCDAIFFFCARQHGYTPITSNSCAYGAAATTGYPITSSENVSFPVGRTIAGSNVSNPIVFTSLGNWPVSITKLMLCCIKTRVIISYWWVFRNHDIQTKSSFQTCYCILGYSYVIVV